MSTIDRVKRSTLLAVLLGLLLASVQAAALVLLS